MVPLNSNQPTNKQKDDEFTMAHEQSDDPLSVSLNVCPRLPGAEAAAELSAGGAEGEGDSLGLLPQPAEAAGRLPQPGERLSTGRGTNPDL